MGAYMTTQTNHLGNEAQYLQRIGALLVLNSPPEALFKEATQLASDICGTTIAHISLIDHNRQWFKASVGLNDVTRIDRDIAFFSHAILQNTVIEIQDARLDERFKNNPLVTQQPNIRFYAGVPIIMPSGKKVGALCAIDQRTGALSPLQKIMLEGLAQVVAQALVNHQQSPTKMKRNPNKVTKVRTTSTDAITNSADINIKSWNNCATKVAA